MSGNPPVNVQQYGQSFWYDSISRELIQSGELQQLIDESGILGMTSNPAIIESAIAEGHLYDTQILETFDLELSETYDALTILDIQNAADLLRPVFERTHHRDGYVCLEVSPLFADDTITTLGEAKRLFQTADRPNVMIKIPGNRAGLPAIEEALFAGVNVNVTLLFSVANYVEVAERYIRALERRLDARLPVTNVASVASFFLGRIDSLIDTQLENNIRSAQGRDLDRVSANNQLLGKVAIANAKVAYKHFKDIFYGERFARLRAAGAPVQRPLWASTGTRNPALRDTIYLESLIGPDTVNTVPPRTLSAFKDHGIVGPTLEKDIDAAQGILDKLTDVGIELDRIAWQLQEDGVETFAESYRKLIARIEAKRKLLMSGFMQRQKLVLGIYQPSVELEIKRLREMKSISRSWGRDATLWKTEQDQIRLINHRLGWLTLATDGRTDCDKLQGLRTEGQQGTWQHIVVLGMGGSSLAAEVLWKTFGQQPGFPAMLVLDSTDPAAIEAVEAQIDLDKTLFVVSSKSGTTLETLALQRYFFAKYSVDAGPHFMAITEAGSPLDVLAAELHFRHTLLCPADVAGRYAPYSYFGLAPAALVGLDFKRILDTVAEMQMACGPNVTGNNHPGIWLGAIMGVLANRGLNKLTLLLSPEIASLGDWIEHLVGESTGKEGRGIVPVTGATVGMPHDYDDDRLFVYMRLDNSAGNPDAQVQMLQEAGNPIVTLQLRDLYDIGAEFFRWEFATSIAGIVLKINPFDEQNVTESKNNTNRLLEGYRERGTFPQGVPAVIEDHVEMYSDATTVKILKELCQQHAYNASDLSGLLAAFLSTARSGDYVSLMAYMPMFKEHVEKFELIQRKLRHTFKRAITVGFGPRFLHSTGQLHKGGPNTGLFIQFTMDDQSDPAIPGLPYGFSILKQAQAAGDLESLQRHGRRVLRLHLSGDVNSGLQKVLDAIAAVAEKRK